MTMRTTTRTVTFHRPFHLKGVDRLLPPANYRVITDEELIEGLSFPAYRRISTAIFVPAPSGSADGGDRSRRSPSGAGTRRSDAEC